MGLIDKAAILAVQDLKRETVAVPEWGGEVIVQELSAYDRDVLFNETVQTDGSYNTVNSAARLLVRCLVDANGQRLFADDEAVALGQRSTTVLKRLFGIAHRINSLDVPEEDIAKN